MARLRLNYFELKGAGLPPLCMRCGRPSDLEKKKTFAWTPGWVYLLLFLGLLPFLIVVLVITRRRRIAVPLCNAHRYHWVGRQGAILGGLFLAVCVFVAVAVLTGGPPAHPQQGVILFFTFIGLFLTWLITAAVLSTRAIRPAKIADESITLVNVSPDFVAAYEEEAHAYARDIDEAVREHWNGSRRAARGGGRSERVRPEDERDDGGE